MPQLYLCCTRFISDIIFLLYVLPAHLPLYTRLLWTLPLSRYLAAMSHYATHHLSSPLCADPPMHTYHSTYDSPLLLCPRITQFCSY